MQEPSQTSALPSRSPATACSALVGQHRGLPYGTRVATGTPGSHLLHAHGPLGQSKLPGQTWLLRCDASPPVFFATASGKGPLPQLHPYRSQGKRGTEKPSRLYGQKRTLTKFPPAHPEKNPRWCRSTKVGPDPDRGDISLYVLWQLEVLIDLPFLNHVLDVAADEVRIRKW